MEILSFASPVLPVKVTCPPLKVPPVKVGIGACVSRVNVSELVPVKPAALVSPATMVWLPSAKPVGVNDQAPVELAVAVAAMAMLSTVKCTTASGSAVPMSVAWVVILSLPEAAVSLANPAVSTGAEPVGAGGSAGALGVVSSVKVSDALPVLPAASDWLATTVCAPAARPLGVKLHRPLASAVTLVAPTVPSMVNLIVPLGAA